MDLWCEKGINCKIKIRCVATNTHKHTHSHMKVFICSRAFTHQHYLPCLPTSLPALASESASSFNFQWVENVVVHFRWLIILNGFLISLHLFHFAFGLFPFFCSCVCVFPLENTPFGYGGHWWPPCSNVLVKLNGIAYRKCSEIKKWKTRLQSMWSLMVSDAYIVDVVLV